MMLWDDSDPRDDYRTLPTAFGVVGKRTPRPAPVRTRTPPRARIDWACVAVWCVGVAFCIAIWIAVGVAAARAVGR